MKDVWEDGVPLTSGRSGLASAVIYQPSCPGNYTQDCFVNISLNREYDDDNKPSDGHDDQNDDSSKSAGSSFHLNCSSNFFSNRSTSSQFDSVEVNDCINVHPQMSGDLYKVMREMKRQVQRHYDHNQLNELQVVKLAKVHSNCRKHSSSSCPLQILKRRFRHFIFKSKDETESRTENLKNSKEPKNLL